MSHQCIINQPYSLPFLADSLTTGLTGFLDVIVLVNGELPDTQPTINYTEIGYGLYTLSITPSVTGIWTIFIEGKLYTIEVVARDIYSILRNLEDESLGSWSWDKTTGILTALRQDGSELATFTVSDTLETASRERTV